MAVVIAIAYVLIAPPSLDLAAHLFRARLFAREGFGVWNDFWYAGHDTPGYSVLFPAVSAALTPQLAAALAAAATAPLFTALAWRHGGSRTLPGSLLFGALAGLDLFTGRLVFAFGALPAMAAVLALDSGHGRWGCVLAALSALCSPIAALFAAIVAGGYALAALARGPGGVGMRRSLAGAAVCGAAIVPILALAVAFPEGGSEPLPATTMLPVLTIAVGGLWCADREAVTLRACLLVYAAAVLVTFLVPSPVGSNVARMATLLGAPVATVVLWRRRPRPLAIAIAPLLYLGIQPAVFTLVAASGRAQTSVAFYRPLVSWLHRRAGPPFRIEIPFTALHWEALRVATSVPIARGWERQLDIRDNPIFYRRGALTAASYRGWLHADAIRYVAVPQVALDPSGRREAALVRSGLPYLGAPVRVGRWRVYAVRDATPIVQGPATLSAIGPDWLKLRATRPGTVLVHVHFSPYWAVTRGAGCVSPAGDLTRIRLTAAGPVRLGIRLALDRVQARSPRCSERTGG